MKNSIVQLMLFLFTASICCMHNHNLSRSKNKFLDLLIYAAYGREGNIWVDDPINIDYVFYLEAKNRIFKVKNSCRDFGQNRSIKFLRKTIAENNSKNSNGILIHATYEETATALNFAAEDRDRLIKGLILETVLASGNTFIEHTLTTAFSAELRWLVELPLAYYWMPYIFKLSSFIFYSPGGKQPIKSIAKIPTDIPIIIINDHENFELSFDEARAFDPGLLREDYDLLYRDSLALYYGLKSRNKNVYFIDYSKRFFLVNIIQKILQKHDLLEKTNNITIAREEIDLNEYQPDHEQFASFYDKILLREKRHEQIQMLLIFGSSCIAVIACMKYFNFNPFSKKRASAL